MKTRIATGINTETFYSIINHLVKTGWKVSIEYSTKLFDKGIDFDFYQLDKNDETVLLAWTNWFEGELKTTNDIIDDIELQFGINFKFGEPEYLNKENFIDEMKELLDFKK